MMTLMIIGILGMAAMPVITSSLGDVRLSSACRVMAGGMEYAATLSNRYQRPFAFSTDIGLNQIEVVDMDQFPPDPSAGIRLGNSPPVNADNVVFNPMMDQWYTMNLDQVPATEGVSISSGPAFLTFFPDGHSTGSDSLYVLALGTFTQTIRVDGFSARVSIE
jgi:type II secretory pathway pseudopilin PulG